MQCVALVQQIAVCKKSPTLPEAEVVPACLKRRGQARGWRGRRAGAEDRQESRAAEVGLNGITYLWPLLGVPFEYCSVPPAFPSVCTKLLDFGW